MITELCIFDFDATLFMSPMFPDDWEGHTGDWFDTLQSLTPPCVVDPNPLWIGSSVSAAQEAIGRPEAYVVLMTGRGMSPELYERVSELVTSAGLSFDEIHLKPGGRTMAWKSSMLEQFIQKFPDLQKVQVWEDRSDHLDHFMDVAERAGLEAVPHFVGNVLKDPCVLDDPVEEAALRQYVRDLLVEVNEYGWNKADRKTMGQDGKAKGRQKKNWMGKNTNDVIANWYKGMGLAEAVGLLSEKDDSAGPGQRYVYRGMKIDMGEAGLASQIRKIAQKKLSGISEREAGAFVMGKLQDETIGESWTTSMDVAANFADAWEATNRGSVLHVMFTGKIPNEFGYDPTTTGEEPAMFEDESEVRIPKGEEIEISNVAVFIASKKGGKMWQKFQPVAFNLGKVRA